MAWPVDGNLIGAIMASVASIISNLGANAQKRSHDLNAEKSEEDQIAYICRPFWWCGMVGVIGGQNSFPATRVPPAAFNARIEC